MLKELILKWLDRPRLSNEDIVYRTLSVCIILIVVTLCIGLFFSAIDNEKIFPILMGFFNLALLAYVSNVKKDKGE